MKRKILIIRGLVVLAIGILIFAAPVVSLAFFILGCIFLTIKRLKRSEYIYLRNILIIALLLRLLVLGIVSSLIYLYYYSPQWSELSKVAILDKTLGHVPKLFRDVQREIENSKLLPRYFRGEYGNIPIKDATYGGHGYVHFGARAQSFLNLFFGPSIFNLFVFSVIGLWIFILVYLLAREIFGTEVARIASILLLITPSYILWSVIDARLTPAIVALLLISLSLLKFSSHNHIKYLLPVLIGFIIFRLAKGAKFLPLISICVLTGTFFSIKFIWKRKLAALLIVALFLFPLLRANPNIVHKIRVELTDIAITQRGYVSLGGSTYKIYDDEVYEMQSVGILPISVFIRALPKALFYFMLVPFPWEIMHNMRLYAYPQIIFWYFILAFSFIGILIGLRYRFKQTALIAAFLLPILIGSSLILGNEGIAARHRDLLSLFFYIYASAAICNFLGRLRGKTEFKE